MPEPFKAHPPEVRAQAHVLFAEGVSKSQIAARLKVSRPTITNWLKDAPGAGAVVPDHGPASDGQIETAGDAIVRNITEAKGGRQRRNDPPPRQTSQTAAPSPGSGAGKPTDAELTKALSEVLCFPAIPMQMIVGCQFCAEHFSSTGGPAAVELVRMSQNSPGLRSALVRLHGIYQILMTGGVLAMYAGKPLIHHLAPNDVLAFAGPFVGVPPRKDMAGHPGVDATPVHSHEHGPAEASTDPAAAAA